MGRLADVAPELNQRLVSPTARPWQAAALLLSAGLEAQASGVPMCPAPLVSTDIGQETVHAPGLPVLGKWMLDHTASPAHWLGEIYQGKKLREPINVVIVDPHAASVDHAKERIIEASARAGYRIRHGHSSGYRALKAGEPHHQLPTGWGCAFSNHLFEVTNNHGRIFGPFQHVQSFVLIGAFSREEVSLLHWPEHRYASFNKARDEYAASLDRETEFKLTGHLDMHNAILDDPKVTTGDHDGKAVVLCSGG
jgi:hypothetical protein